MHPVRPDREGGRNDDIFSHQRGRMSQRLNRRNWSDDRGVRDPEDANCERCVSLNHADDIRSGMIGVIDQADERTSNT